MWVQCLPLIVLVHVVQCGTHKQLSAMPQRHRHRGGVESRRSYTSGGPKLRHSGYHSYDETMHERTTKMRTTTHRPLLNYSKKDFYRDDDVLEYSDDIDEKEEEDDNSSNYDNWYDEKRLENDYEDDDDYQAEEATSAPSTLTQYKWDHFGTRDKVEETRRQMMQYKQPSSAEYQARAALDHIRRVSLQGKCVTPKLKVVHVQNEHPSPGKRYIPHCTMLHRCSEDTGCCSEPDTKCQPKKQILVHLYFYTTKFGESGNRIEKLAFYNHTECGCLKVGSTPEDVETAAQNLRARNPSLRSATHLLEDNQISCDCPEEFLAKRRYDKCVCDCSNSNSACISMKRGNEHFSLKDRKCILEGKCGEPVCEYGAFVRSRGRCPRKQEKLDAYASVSAIRNQN